jgi:type II secretory pathway component PulJ
MDTTEIKFEEMKGRGGREGLKAEVEGFDVRVTWDYDESWDYSHYGVFCEEKNAPEGAFLIRNPDAWRKVDRGEGSPSWERTSHRAWGWFAVYEIEERVKWRMSNGISEQEAWRDALDDARMAASKLAAGDLFGIVVTVEAWRNGVELGRASIGGIECEGWVKLETVEEAAREYGLVEEAVASAKSKLNELCVCH